MDRRVGKDGFRKLVDSKGTTKKISGRPYELCDELVESDVELMGNDLRYVQAFEMMAPVYDYAMFAPGDLSNWNEIT